jgi:alkylation response protein AidB-like acyl-CoA dehydrogenase
MDFNLSEEHQILRETVRQFAETEIKPHAAELDETARFPKELFYKAAELGLAGVTVKEEFGGAGMDNLAYAIAIEEVSRVDASMGVILSVNNSLACDPISDFGTPAQKEKYLKPLASGQKLGCFCLTEANAGSDAGSIQTVAERRGDRYVLNGSKNFITCGDGADIAIVFASTDRALKHKGITAFIVEAEWPGFHKSKVENKMGIRCSGSSEIVLEDLEVPAENLLAGEGQGFKIAMHTLDRGRIGIAAQALGIAQAALEEAVAYARQREQFGEKIGTFQAIQWKLADMATQVEAARLMTYRAALLKYSGQRFSKEAAMAKMFASEVSHFVTHSAVQVFGGYGYIKEFPVERFYRDSRITEIYEGTNEIQRMVIAASILKD